jgi:hypothetical protein
MSINNALIEGALVVKVDVSRGRNVTFSGAEFDRRRELRI